MNNPVRQTLMNELGLTRDIVKQEMYEIIREAIKQEIAKPEFLDKLVHHLLYSKGNIKWDIIDLTSGRLSTFLEKKFVDFLNQKEDKQ